MKISIFLAEQKTKRFYFVSLPYSCFIIEDRQSGHFSAYLVSKSDKVNFDLECTFIVLDRVNGTSNKIGTIEKSASYWKKNEGFGISKLLANQKLFRTRNCYVKDGKFHLIVIIKQVIRNLQNSETYYYEKYLLESLKNRLDQSEIIELFDTMTSENFRDDTIILETADGVKMSASKEIISKKSPVFAAMFTTNMVERSRGVVKVIDFSGKALRESLRFMYFGRVQSIEEIVTELYEVAKVYLIEGLGDLCLSSIKSRTNFSNVFEVLEFAHVHDETGIFDDCCEIIWR